MARTAIPVVDISTRGGVVIGATATSPVEVTGDSVNNHTIDGNNGRVILHARSTSAGTITLSVLPGAGVAGFTMPTRVISRVGVGDLLIGPFPPSAFGSSVSIDVNSTLWKLRAYKLGGTPTLGSSPPTPPASAGSRVLVPLTAITRAGIDITAGVSEVVGAAAGH